MHCFKSSVCCGFESPDPHCFPPCFHTTGRGQQTAGQIHQQLSKISRALPGFTASMRLSQALALPSIPQLPVEVANYQTSIIQCYNPKIKKKEKKGGKKDKKGFCNKSSLNYHMGLLVSFPAMKRHSQLPVKFTSMSLASAPSCLATFIWSDSRRIVTVRCLGSRKEREICLMPFKIVYSVDGGRRDAPSGEA